MSNQRNNQLDPLLALKYVGFCRSQTPPGVERLELKDFVNLAKFSLCKFSNRLWKDPIWDSYTDEEILAEYYSHVFSKDEEAKNKFIAEMNAGGDVYGEDIYEWLERKVKENQEEMRKKIESQPSKVSFSPETGTDVEE